MGTEEFWVPALVGALGTGAEYVNQKQANNRQNDAEITAMQHQQALEDQATAAARATTQKIATDSPKQIASKATGDYVAQLRKNAAGSTQGGPTTGGTQTFGNSTSSLAPAAAANSRYGAATANSQQEVQNYGDTYANEMGAIDAATRMRENEGLGMQDLGTKLNTLAARSYGQNFVDQLRAQVAGRANPWVSLVSGLMKNGANAYAMNAGAGSTSRFGRIPAGGVGISADNGLTGATGVFA